MAQNNKSIKIAMCINNLEAGGAEKQFLYIYQYLKKFYDVNIFLINNKGLNFRKFDKNTKKKINIGLISYLFYILKNKPKVSLFFLPKSYFIFGFISIFFLRLKKIMFRRSLNYYQSNVILKKLEIFLHKFMDLICTNSYASQKEMIKYENIKLSKIFILKNFIDKKKFTPNHKLVLNKKSINFLCISNFINYKGHRLILKTFNHLGFKKKWNIYFFGKKKDFDFKDLKNLALKYKINKRLFYIDRLSKNLEYPNIKYGLLFSKNESFPNAILEYLKLGLSVIAFNTGDIRKLLEKNGMVFNSRNPKKIAQELKLFLRKKRKKNYKKELKKILNPYQSDKCFRILKNKIDNLCVDY